jgi:3-hydroxybutyryl-CoA dehydratase
MWWSGAGWCYHNQSRIALIKVTVAKPEGDISQLRKRAENSVLKSLNINVGMKTCHVKTITEADVMRFAELSGDFNPVHVSEDFARKTLFGGRIAHGMLVAGLISAAVAKLPGLVIYLSQTVKFLKPVRIGDSITATAEVIDKDDRKGILKLKITCVNQDDETVVSGESSVRIYKTVG